MLFHFFTYPTSLESCTSLISTITCRPLILVGNHRTSFYVLPSNTLLTHCMAALLRKVDSILSKELGRQTGRSTSPMEQTPSPSCYQGRGGGTKKVKI